MPHRFAVLIFLAMAAGCGRQAPLHEVVVAQEDLIKIDMNRLSDGRAHFFTYRHKGKNINFFVRTDGQMTLRAHFDACYSCYKYKRGYFQESNQVVCVACRIGYDLDTPVWEFVGACIPITLKCRVEDSSLTLPVRAVEKGERFF